MSIKKQLSSLLAAAMIAAVPLAAMVAAPAVQAQESSVAATAPATVSPTGVSKETVDNPYGLDALWKQGDFVSKTTLMILLIMSIGSWYILAIKLYEQFKLRQQAQHMQETFWSAGSIEKGIDALSKGGPFHYIADTGVKAVTQFQNARPDSIDLNSWAIMAIQRAADSVQNRMQDGLSFLATVGSTAPFLEGPKPSPRSWFTLSVRFAKAGSKAM